MFNITNWNLNPNQNWFVKFHSDGATILIYLHNTLFDAQNGLNIVATGSAVFGENVEVTFVPALTGSPVISLFNTAVPFHAAVTGYSADLDKIYHLYPFVDIQEINNSIYRSEDLILRRVTNEINKHTHVSKNKTVALAGLLDSPAIQDVLTINSVFKNETTVNLINEITISGSQVSLLSTIGCVEYIDFVR